MIKKIEKENLAECASVIHKSFMTVAQKFNITPENAPKYVAFSTDEQKLSEQFDLRLMFGYFEAEKLIGFYSLVFFDKECELNNLCVLPEYRTKGVGEKLLLHSFETAKNHGANRINISIVNENTSLKKWYEKYGFVFDCSKKYDFFPFTCGYMSKIF